MPKQENTAINDLIGLRSQRPIDVDEPALFDAAAPVARLRPPPFGGSLAPIGAAIAPLPRRRAPAATPAQVPRQPIYADEDDDDSETTIGAPPQWPSVPSLGHEAESYTVNQPDTGPFAPQPLPAAPMYAAPIAAPIAAPQVGYAYPPAYAPAQPAYVRPAYPPPHAPPAYYQAPLDHTMRVRALPLEAEPSLASEVLATMARFWMPFAALGVIAMALAGYRLLKDDDKVAAAAPEAPIVMASVPADPVAAAPPTGKSPLAAAMVGERLAAEPTAEPIVEPTAAAVAVVEPDPNAVPASSKWQPTVAQPTIAPTQETVAVAAAEPAAEPTIETSAPAVEEPKPVARTSKPKKDRSQSRRAKRAAAKREKQVAMAEIAPTRTAKRPAAVAPAEPKETKVVTIAAAKPMKIGATTVASATGAASGGKLTVSSTPSTLIYVDGRNTGMMTPKTLSLPEGSHKITLLSPKDRIAKTISVDIAPGTSAKVSKDFTK